MTNLPLIFVLLFYMPPGLPGDSGWHVYRAYNYEEDCWKDLIEQHTSPYTTFKPEDQRCIPFRPALRPGDTPLK